MIPKVIYQSWKTKDLPSYLKANIDSMREMNPEYEYVLYDDKDCRKFLLEEYGENYLNAFDSLIPGAFKCDFWRYAMLYKYGGVYIDIDMVPLVPFREIINENDTFVSIIDRTHSILDFNNRENYNYGIYQAFFACIPYHEITGTSLSISFSNIVTRINSMKMLDFNLGVTGPEVMGIAVNLFLKKKNTLSAIEQKIYEGGLNLSYKSDENYIDENYTVDLKNKKIFKNKLSDFGSTNISYGFGDTFKDKKSIKKKILFIVLVMILIIMACLFVARHYRKKLYVCQSTCKI